MKRKPSIAHIRNALRKGMISAEEARRAMLKWHPLIKRQTKLGRDFARQMKERTRYAQELAGRILSSVWACPVTVHVSLDGKSAIVAHKATSIKIQLS